MIYAVHLKIANLRRYSVGLPHLLYTRTLLQRERERERAHIPVNIHNIVFTVLEKKIRYCTVLIIYIYAVLTSIHPLLKIFKMHYSFSYANKLVTSL
jgi:hypothetical protein